MQDASLSIAMDGENRNRILLMQMPTRNDKKIQIIIIIITLLLYTTRTNKGLRLIDSCMWCSQIVYGATISFLFELFSNKDITTQQQHIMAPPLSSDEMTSTRNTTASATTTTASADPYKSSSFVGHSLWMIPAGKARDAYDDIVGTTARELDTFHFLPHVTLVAALMTPVEDVVARTRHLGTLLGPYEFELDDISQRDAFFQCVYCTMKLTDAAVHANGVARQIFEEKRSDPPYMPHLSLIYGDFPYERKVQEIIPQLRDKFEARAPDTLKLPVEAIEIWSTQGDVKDWYLVERVPLTGPSFQNNDKQ